MVHKIKEKIEFNIARKVEGEVDSFGTNLDLFFGGLLAVYAHVDEKFWLKKIILTIDKNEGHTNPDTGTATLDYGENYTTVNGVIHETSHWIQGSSFALGPNSDVHSPELLGLIESIPMWMNSKGDRDYASEWKYGSELWASAVSCYLLDGENFKAYAEDQAKNGEESYLNLYDFIKENVFFGQEFGFSYTEGGNNWY